MPVTLPPGRARLSTKPAATGSSPPPVMTMGIVLVASWPPGLACCSCSTMISTLRRTSSAASSGYRSCFPSAYRYSMAMFCPSMYPSSRRASRIASARADSRAASTRRKITYAGYFLRLLRISREVGSKEQGAKRRANTCRAKTTR